jgi:hypothetical protein
MLWLANSIEFDLCNAQAEKRGDQDELKQGACNSNAG